MLRFKKTLALLLAVLCISTVAFPASAAPAVASKAAGEFGTITGTLYDAAAAEINGFSLYEFTYWTDVTNLPGSTARLLVGINLMNNLTGASIDAFTDYSCHTPGSLSAGYYYQLDHIDNFKNINFAVFGCHECILRRPTAAGAVTNGS